MCQNNKRSSLQWIDPVGGYGDILLISSVLNLVHKHFNGRQYNMVRRTRYNAMLAGHPAIANIDFRPAGVKTLSVAYWLEEEFNTKPGIRAFQMLAKMFGLPIPVPEKMYLPLDGVSIDILDKQIPWGRKTVAIAPYSASPRKELPAATWEKLTSELTKKGVLVLQFGAAKERKFKHTYSLSGLTTPKEAIMLLSKTDLLISPDNFFIHAAHFTGTPAIGLWGATPCDVYGYPEQYHIKTMMNCQRDCINNTDGKMRYKMYKSLCPEDVGCMARIDADEILAAAYKLLKL